MSPLRLGAPVEEVAVARRLLGDVARADLFADLDRVLGPASRLRRDEPMARRTTLRVGGPADLFLEAGCEADLVAALDLARHHGVPAFLLGRGSNLLVRDGGIRGLVVSLQTPGFSALTIDGCWLRAGAGASLRELANEARRAGLAGLEFLEGIPGSVVGALRMNAGAMGGWTFDVVETLRYLDADGTVREMTGADAGAGYRECPLLRDRVALGAVFRGNPGSPDEIGERMRAGAARRWSSQPRQPSSGCTFKNPSREMPAGRLVDELGLKGMRVWDAMVSPVHGNFFVNCGRASARDVLELIEAVRRRTLAERGIALETEVEIVGEDA